MKHDATEAQYHALTHQMRELRSYRGDWPRSQQTNQKPGKASALKGGYTKRGGAGAAAHLLLHSERYEQVLEVHGQPCSRNHRNVASWPPAAAKAHVHTFHGHPCSRTHCTTSMCPP